MNDPSLVIDLHYYLSCHLSCQRQHPFYLGVSPSYNFLQILSPLHLPLPNPIPDPLIPKVARQIRAQLRHEHTHSGLILPILGILPGGDLLRQPSRALEEGEVGHGPGERPVEVGVGDVAGPLVQHDPDGLLGREVGVSAPGPETGDVEAAV